MSIQRLFYLIRKPKPKPKSKPKIIIFLYNIIETLNF